MTVQTAVLRYDPVLVAVARSPMPPRDLVVGAVRTAADVRRVCVLWALHVAADSHVQTVPGELFPRASNDEASRYVPAVPLFESSKSAAGGATSLTRYGFNGLMTLGVLTNDGRRGAGYRFVTGGDEVAETYGRIAEGLTDRALREFFLDALDNALTGACATAPLPDHHRLFARLTYARNRRARGYLDVAFGAANAREVASFLGGARLGAVLVGGSLEVAPDPEGWTLTRSGRFQATSLRRVGLPEPPESIKSVTRTVGFSKADGILTCQLSIKDKP